MGDFVSLDPGTLSSRSVYDLLVSCIQPRPIAFVSTVGADGARNLAPFSFFVAGGANPPSLVYSAALDGKGQPKDSLRHVLETREFVVNVVTREMAEGMNATSYPYPPGFDEWPVCGFSPVASDLVRPERVQESPAQFECRLFQVVEHGDGPSSARYVVGEVVRMHLREDAWDGNGVVLGAIRPIARLGGPQYLDTDAMEVFSLARPSAAPERRSVEE